jgi:glycosyltransferase involved in cell wall biosynthesis
MFITAPLHPEVNDVRPYEIELLGRPIPHRGWWPLVGAYDQARKFKPDVVITELLRDPRWRVFAHLGPRIRLVHDAEPHDNTQRAPWWNRMFFDRWDAEADATIVFSDYVADRVRADAKQPVYVAPLSSDLDLARVPDFVPGDQRRDFLLIGRQYPYKNHSVVFAAWDAHVRGPSWRGDDLVILGGGEISDPLPPNTTWHRGSYRYSEIIPRLAAAKGSVVFSRAASQSGVQVLSMQLGVPTLVSNAGALGEFQPMGINVMDRDDSVGLARAMDAVADPAESEAQGRRNRDHYLERFGADIAAKKFIEIFEDVMVTHSRR